MENITVNEKTWEVQDSFFDDCIDLVCGEETITVSASATKQEIIDLLSRG